MPVSRLSPLARDLGLGASGLSAILLGMGAAGLVGNAIISRIIARSLPGLLLVAAGGLSRWSVPQERSSSA